MSEFNELATPHVRNRPGPSIIWLVPLVTALVGGWLILRTLTDQVPEATVSFKTAEGIEAGKTKVKYKSVDIGIVNDIRFADDFEGVLLTVEFNQDMEGFLRRNTRFWVVRPQLSLRGVSGLETLISGAYIEIDPGPGAPQTHFVGLEQQPLITTDDAGTRITLVTDNLGSIGARSPIYYQGIFAGEVLGYELASDAKSIYIHGFVRAPLDQLVRGNSRFWNVSGVDVSIGADGLEVRTASMQALMFGGIAFETRNTLEVGTTDVSNLIFTLHDSYASIAEQSFTRKLQFVMYFRGSVRGLSPGAPVEFKGIRIGSVLDVKLEFNSEDSSFRIPVLVEIEPDRIIPQDDPGSADPGRTLQVLVDRGLRGRLQTGNLLTGQLFVEFNMFPDSPIELVGGNSLPYPELPTTVGSFEAVTQSVQTLMTKLEEIDINEMGDRIVSILSGADNLINTPAQEATVTDLQASIRSLRNILQQVETADLSTTVSTANEVLANIEATLKMVDGVLTPNSPLHYNLITVTSELEETARAIRSLVETLQRQPQSLIFGRGDAEGEEQ